MAIRTLASAFLAGLLLAGGAPALDDGEQEGEANLLPPVGSPEPGARGEVEIELEGDEQEFEVEAEDLGANPPYSVWLEDPAGSGLFTSVGVLALDDDDDDGDEWEFEVETDDGETLPLGVTSVTALVGRGVQVRDAADAIVLEGTVPALDDMGEQGEKAKGRLALVRPEGAPEPFARGEIETESKPLGDDELEVEIEKVGKNPPYELWLETAAGAGDFMFVGTLLPDDEDDDDDEFSIEFVGALPFGATSVNELAGLALQIRDGLGQVVLVGAVPLAGDGGSGGKGLATMAGTPGLSFLYGRSRPLKPDEIVLVVGKKLPPATAVELWVADDEWTLADAVETDEVGRALFLWRTQKGQMLPLGGLVAAQLAGAPVEVRRASDGAVLLTGVFPAVE